MKILLINPPFLRLKGIKKVFFPLGLGYLASSLNRNGFICKIYNAEIPAEKLRESIDNKSLLINHYDYIKALGDNQHIVWKEIKQTLANFNPDIVGVSVMSPIYGSALKISQIVKEYSKDCKVIWGGAHPTVEAGRVLLEKTVDFIIRGEGENTIVELCKSIASGRPKDFSDIKGLSYRVNGNILHNQPRELVKDLDILTFPARKLLLYGHLYPSSAFGTLITSRGCPFECGYCSAHHIWGRDVRFRTTENVISELINIYDNYKTREFYFFDDNFTLNHGYASKLCNAIIKRKLDISWNCITRADLIDDGLLKIMKEAGCSHIDIGIESASPRILELINKKVTLGQIKQTSRLLKNNRMSWGAFFMMGFPQETENELKKTLQFMKELSPISIEFSLFTPYPGTKLYELSKKLRAISEDVDWSRFSHQSPENYFMKNVSREKFDYYLKEFSKFIDAYNNSLKTSIRKVLNRYSYWIKHPALFLRKSSLFIKKRLKLKT